MKTFVDEICSTDEGRRNFYRELAFLDATCQLCRLMQDQGVSRRNLARRLKVKKSWLDGLLNDDGVPVDLRHLSDVALALGHRIVVRTEPIDRNKER